MTKRISQTHSPESPPDWYWVKGLHDAHITLVESFEFPFDYDRYIREKNTYDRNCLTLTVDAAGAMFDTSVREIRLYNYKYLSPETTPEGHGALWWIGDRLTARDGRFELEIDLYDGEAFPEEFTVRVRFERAEVER
ncbi:MAG: hypothetical protein J6K29_06440 [Clostridia bacterium]|nr:hypothetical protein [Clostridia bacterium]